MARGIPETIQRWHVIALERRADDLAGILAEDCVFESPVVHTPQKGRVIVEAYLRGALHVLDAVLPALLARGRGHLSLVSSVAGYRGLPQSLAYGPTKAALINLAESLYLDLRPAGIGVYLVNPGYVDTPATATKA